ncbi:hypothetical protein RIF29_28594 [Crotalaria pallida]|uniref:Retroviral polymerase SH3-like domain-containing protein n=1 Tax=Crotalaria pallida TaxID=3830 RepID=A0AAN9HWN5_CROPI
MEMWTGKPPSYSSLHVFGCPVYVMYNSQERDKLDSKSRKCLFLGYADGVKGYRLWDPTPRKVVISKDVTFAENDLQSEQRNESSTKETTTVQIDEKSGEDDSSEVEPEHEEQEPDDVNDVKVRQSDRLRRKPHWHKDFVMVNHDAYCLLTEEGEPSTFQEAVNSSDASLWMAAMHEEMEALQRNKTWELVTLPEGRKAIGNKWVYKIKRDDNDQEFEVREARKLRSSNENVELLKEKLLEKKNRTEWAELELSKLQEVQLNMKKLEDQISSWRFMIKDVPGVSCFEDILVKFAALQKHASR